MSLRACRCVVLILLPILVSAVQPLSAQDALWPEREIATALSYIRLTPADLALRDDYVTRDSCRLSIVDRVMRDAKQAPALLTESAQRLIDTAYSPQAVPLPYLVSLARGDTATVGNAPEPPADAASHTQSLLPQDRFALSPEWKAFFEYLEKALSMQDWPDSVLSDLSKADRRFVLEQVPVLLMEDEEDKNKSAETLDSLQKVEDDIAEHFAGIAGDVRWQWVYDRGVPPVDRLVHALPSTPPSFLSSDTVRREPLTVSTAYGDIILGTTGDDHYTGAPIAIIDPDGNDRYDLEPLPIAAHRLLVDYSGDDQYDANGGYDLGAARFGWGVLVDFKGDDTYRAGNFSLGSGWFGIGILVDLAGRDMYTGDVFTQGAGAFGVGLLHDRSGADQFTGRQFAQGFGFAAGVGVLADARDNDIYTAGGKYIAILNYPDRYYSLSQGFGYGLRPHFSGGVGLLLDNTGNDVYVADIFGQACSYWWAFGGIYDGGGNDHYIAYQYAQGSATHLTAGCLLDISGDDRYESKGVSQGCGHDWATALLIDAAGDDRYVATDLSQAAGSANGIGALIDFGGNDGYYVVSSRNTQGYGNPRREYGSIGLFLDLDGDDRYDGPGANGSVWLGPSRWGVGVDADSTWMTDTAAVERGEDN